MISLPDKFLRSSAACRLLTMAAAVAFLTFAAADGWPASQFELEIGELEGKSVAAQEPKVKPTSRAQKPHRRTPVNPGRPSARDLEGEFTSYTILPGDHIFKVLTSRFGLSSARAEELIPRILRVNGVRDVRGLQVGRTIRIPLPDKPAGGASQPPPQAVPVTVPEQNRAALPAPVPATLPEARPAEPVDVAAIPAEPAPAVNPTAAAPPSSPATGPQVMIRVIPSTDPRLAADAILDALSLKWSKDRPVTIPLGKSGGASLTVPVDRYFEAGGKRFFLDFGSGDPDRVTYLRLVELAGYRRIVVDGKDDFRSIAGRLLEALELKADYRKHMVVPGAGASGGFEVAGYLVAWPAEKYQQLFLTDGPLEKPLADLVDGGGFAVR